MRHGGVFFHVAGGGPGGEFGGVVFVGVGHNGFEDVQGHGGFVRGIGQAAGGAGLAGEGGAFGADEAFKGGDVRIEVRDEIGGLAHADEGGGEGEGIGGKGASGIKQGLVAGAVGHEEFAADGGVAEQHEGVRGVDDGEEVIVQMKAAGDFAEDGAVGLLTAGDLAGSEGGGAGDGSVDERELLSTEAGDGKIGGVGEAKGVHGFEGGYEAVDFLFHNIFLSG